MDFVEVFPKVGDKSVVLTVVDRFSKMAHFIALAHPYMTASVAKVFFEGIVRLHGFPCSIVSDQGTVFTSAFWAELFRLAGVAHELCLPPSIRCAVRGHKQHHHHVSPVHCR